MRRYLSYVILLFSVTCIFAQNSTNSPYSRFGYGELNDNAIGANRAMGGLTIGMRQNNVINAANPAAYSAIDSTIFMFDIGASLLGTFYNDANGRNAKINGNLEYVNLQFPIWKYFGASFGIMPYSSTGYSFSLNDSIGKDLHYTKTYNGYGGIMELYGGFSANIMDWLALGFNAYFMKGDINNVRAITFKESLERGMNEVSNMEIRDYRLRYGAQFFHTFGQHSFVLGGIFENSKKLNCNFKTIETTTKDTTLSVDAFSLPMVWGAGFSYTYDNRLTVGAEYMKTDWSHAMYFSKQDSLKSRSKISIGAQYRHNPVGRNYAERMYWRTGFSISDSYILQNSVKDYCVSVGVGFPLRNIGTVINTTVEYGHRGAKGSLRENYIRFTLSASIAENWFMKRRL